MHHLSTYVGCLLQTVLRKAASQTNTADMCTVQAYLR